MLMSQEIMSSNLVMTTVNILAIYIALYAQMCNTYHTTTFYRKMKYNQKNGLLMRISINSRNQQNRIDSKKFSQPFSAGYQKMHF